jgi:hypothetical protein
VEPARVHLGEMGNEVGRDSAVGANEGAKSFEKCVVRQQIEAFHRECLSCARSRLASAAERDLREQDRSQSRLASETAWAAATTSATTTFICVGMFESRVLENPSR